MTRVIAGEAGGRRLAVPAGTGTRPTSDRAREGLFSTWQSLLGAPLNGERVLDLYAGSGAIGLEALSRGASHTLLVEADPKAARVIRENVKNIGLPGPPRRPGQGGQSGTDRPDTGADGPVRHRLPRPAVRCHRSRSSGDSPHTPVGGWLAPDALVTVERSTRGGEFGWPDGFDAIRARRYGEGTFWYGRAASTCEDAR